MDNKLLSLLSQIEINLFVLKQQKNTVIDFLKLLNITAENQSLLQDFFNTFEHGLVNINTHVDVLKSEISTGPTGPTGCYTGPRGEPICPPKLPIGPTG